jgi:hypothetical protein
VDEAGVTHLQKNKGILLIFTEARKYENNDALQ